MNQLLNFLLNYSTVLTNILFFGFFFYITSLSILNKDNNKFKNIRQIYQWSYLGVALSLGYMSINNPEYQINNYSIKPGVTNDYVIISYPSTNKLNQISKNGENTVSSISLIDRSFIRCPAFQK